MTIGARAAHMAALAGVLMAAFMGLTAGCAATEGRVPTDEWTEGVVRRVDIEGGCWVIEAEGGGGRFSPRGGIPEAFRRDGMRVRYRGRPLDGVMGICMVGPYIEVLDIEALGGGSQ